MLAVRNTHGVPHVLQDTTEGSPCIPFCEFVRDDREFRGPGNCEGQSLEEWPVC